MGGMHMLPVLPGSQPIGVLAIYKCKVDWNHPATTQSSLLNRRRSTGRCGEQMFNKRFPALKYGGGEETYGGSNQGHRMRDEKTWGHSSVLAWRIPGMREPGGLPSMGSHRVGHDWSDLAVAGLYSPWKFPDQILEWVAFPCSRGIFPTQGSNPGHLHCRHILYQLSHRGKPKNIQVGSLSVLQGIFLTQESNWGILHCRWILYQLSYEGSPCLSIRR